MDLPPHKLKDIKIMTFLSNNKIGEIKAEQIKLFSVPLTKND